MFIRRYPRIVFALKVLALIPISLLWIWAIFVEPYGMLDVTESRIFLPNWNANLNGIKVVVLGDIHAGRGPLEKYRLQNIVDAVNAQKPDVVFLVGDYVNGSFYQTVMDNGELSDFLSRIDAPKYGIFGNHDFYYDIERVRKILEKGGVKVLQNSSAKVSLPRGEFYVAGIADPYTMDYFYKRTLQDVPKGAPLVFLSHGPDVIRELPRGVDFMLSGHTHGGQVRIPYLGAIRTNSSLGRKSASGWIVEDGKSAYVVRGLGTSRLPVRFNCSPEIAVIGIFRGDASLNKSLK